MEEYNGLITPDFSNGINLLSEALTKMSEGFYMTAKAFEDIFSNVLVSITPMMGSLTHLIESTKRDDADRTKALELGLVGHKVVQLSYRGGRIGKKNMNRIRKELKLYERRK